MIQTLIVILIVTAVALISARKILRIIKGKERSCNCTNKDCKCCKKENNAI